MKLRDEQKNHVAELARRLLSGDFDPILLGQKTLYQITEFYGQKYNFPSLVDTIFFFDTLTRKSMIAAFAIAIFVFRFDLLAILLSLLAAYYIPYAIANIPILYHRIK